MDKKGLMTGIDFTEEFCKVCYFNEKHGAVENVLMPQGNLGLLIPSVMSYDEQRQKWLIGEEARVYSRNTGAVIFTDLLTAALAGERYEAAGMILTGEDLLSIFIACLLDLARTCSGIYPIGRVNIAMRRVNSQVKELMERVFLNAGMAADKVRILNYPECFAYFILQQDEELWREGARLFDFSKDGFYLNHLTWKREKDKQTIFVSESNYSMEFSVKDLENEVRRPRLDEKLNELYEEIKGKEVMTSVYFTGLGFEELWFPDTLENISKARRAFRGNNIYAKGACLEALLRKEQTQGSVTVICRPKTRAQICVEARVKGKPQDIILSGAAVNWYEASGERDFILDGSGRIDLKITSLMSAEETVVSFNLTSFPMRPPKTTRVRVSAKYINEYECEICVSDLGFGEIFPSSGRKVRKILDLEGYI